jgi:peptidoglycan/LPS O-acetylase OafA/YrhL
LAFAIRYYDLLGASFYVANCVMGLLCAFVIFFLVEAPALRLKVPMASDPRQCLDRPACMEPD